MTKKVGLRELNPRTRTFPVVAIGGSAGGIEAISDLLAHLRPDLNMAYVVILHLSPHHKSMLPALFQRKTSMPVVTATHGLKLAPNQVFVIPPDAYLSVQDGHFVSSKQSLGRPYHPIDYFFISVSEVYKNNVVGIVLSGLINDGTAGTEAIKSEGGITFAQNDTALFSSMPQHAIDSGFTDFILSPSEIATELEALIKIPYLKNAPEKLKDLDEKVLKLIQTIVHKRRGVNFAQYKQTTISRRILRRMTLNQLKNLDDYLDLLGKSELEVESLYRDLLIHVTSFFRDPPLYDYLSTKLFPRIFSDRKANEPIRIWIPACSTGEEACTFAICLFEFLGEKALTAPLQIFATDLSEAAIDRARTGIYSESAMSSLPQEWLAKYFIKLDSHYQVLKQIRDVCIFSVHNLLEDPPFSRMDIISCQNVLIYLESAPQKRILNVFHYALKTSGYLILGKSETVGNSNDIFEQVDKDFKAYSKKAVTPHLLFDFPSGSTAFSYSESAPKKVQPKPYDEMDVDKDIDRLLLSKFVPATVVVNSDLHIVRFQGATANYLQPASGKATFNLLKMVRNEILFELRAAIHKAKREGLPVKKEGILLIDRDIAQEISLEVVPFSTRQTLFFMIVFKETSERKTVESPKKIGNVVENAKDKRIKSLEQELQEGREHMKIMSEEFEVVKEELQSANEEVISSNEELQSINEELETSKEELQSSNEELTTINEELQNRNTELKDAVAYTEAIVQTVNEPLLVIGSDFRVQSANKAFFEEFGLTGPHTHGRNLFEIAGSLFDLPAIKSNLLEVFHSDVRFQDVEVIKDSKGDRVVFLYSALRLAQNDKKTDSVLFAIKDISQKKIIEQTLINNEERFRLLVKNAFDILAILSKEGNIMFLSGSVESILGYKPEERLGSNIFKDSLVHPDDAGLELEMINNAINQPESNVKTEFRLRHRKGTHVVMEVVCINLLGNPVVNGIICNYRDVTQRRLLEKQKEEFLSVASHELKTPVTSIKGYTEILIDNFDEVNDKVSSGLVRKLNTQVDRLTDLIKDLLDVAKIKEGQLEFKKDSVDINALIEEVTDDLQYVSASHQLITHLAPARRVWADKERIRQVLINLMSNAIKYSPSADKIIIRSEADEKNVTVCVKDYGIGMSKEAQAKVFDRFFRVSSDHSQTFPGLGLGLFISSEILKRHNGRIWVTSDKNEGSEFCFSLPFG